MVGGAGQRTHLISTSPRFPANLPSMYSSVDASCRFMYASVDTRNPLYSMPHLSLTITGFPVSSFKNGLGLIGTVCGIEEYREEGRVQEGSRLQQISQIQNWSRFDDKAMGSRA